jgi:hypothetical protein
MDETKAVAIAKELFEVFVQDGAFWQPEEADLSSSLMSSFRSKWRLYREATVLTLLLSKQDADTEYLELAREFERLVFGSSPSPAASAKVAEIDAAMKEIYWLVETGKGNELTWAEKWFESLGELPNNPATLIEFALASLDFYIAVAKGLTEAAAAGIIP